MGKNIKSWEQRSASRCSPYRCQQLPDTMAASVRVCGPPNSNFLVGYPGISATLVREAQNVVLAGSFGRIARVATDSAA